MEVRKGTQVWGEKNRFTEGSSFGVETTAPGLSAARLAETLAPNQGRRGGRGCVVKKPLVRGSPSSAVPS